MSQVCSKCSHVNPPEAIFCYFDGVTLGGRSANGRPVQAGSQPFPSQFVFPSGQSCRNFDQLAVACQENWNSAVDLLKQGFLASFLGGIGRADLAVAAKEAARFPDTDRGLDRLLAKLPSQVLAAPKLRAEPTDVNLGVIPFGTNRKFELHLSNLGMRLLYGSVSSDCKWLTLGDAPGNSQKLIQFGGEAMVLVQIRGQYLRAGNKALEGHLLVETNGGNATVTVRVDVPPKQYPNGVLAGAATPRQIAEKALAMPKEAAMLFESGAVARWFGENGWTYPVRGPSATGVGAVQQFFEALGLAKAPKVEISHTALMLRGSVGQSVQATLELKTQEKRPVYAHAVCDQPWLDVSQSVLNGRNAAIQVLVPHVPSRPGETLTANVTVTSNGNQRFKVTVSLEIGGQASQFPDIIPMVPLADEQIPVVQPIPVPSVGAPPFVPLQARQTMADNVPFADVVELEEVPNVGVVTARVPTAPYVPVAAAPTRTAETVKAPLAVRLLMHAVPACLLAFLLLLLCGRDIFFAPAVPDDTIPIDPNPRIAVYFDESGKDEHDKMLTRTMTFGVIALPKNKSDAPSNLTYDKFGRTNSTLIRVGGVDHVLGISGTGKWTTLASPLGEHGGRKSVWVLHQDQSKIQVTQLVDVIPGEPLELKSGKLKRYWDTCRIRYLLENKGNSSVDVGLRMVLDTLIGGNDGVPFTVPGRKGLVDKMADFPTSKQIPDFVQVLEVPNLANPGVVGFVSLKLGGAAEAPNRMLLTEWPGPPRNKALYNWDVPLRPFDVPLPGGVGGDSAVVLYWNPKLLKPGESREVGYAYGPGNMAIAGGKLGISVGGNFTPHGELTVVALVNDPEKGQELTLRLKEGLRLLEGESETQPVPMAQAGGAQQSPVTWRIRADREGTFDIEVLSSTGISQKKRITIKAKTIF